jgi:hypothetical protein
LIWGRIVADKQDERTLNNAASVPLDTRPRFLWISTPLGTLRIRRMSIPQLFTQIQNFRGLGLLSESGEWRPAETAPQLLELSKFLQRCLVNESDDILSFPGQRGLREVLTWSADRRREIAKSAAEFMEV